ncbi:Beta-1,3-galactosyltransferase 5 [Pseudolycoriella hygida]|uniref:Hexosyltransferase n=1 Tax=Pseudolycoriella hygida TaxID=35572 RepID=A0A9Q0RZ32_9DIPT|nr:Beta-1,3-galactosyltransferase 5 [Pseudolycoriella hygida]
MKMKLLGPTNSKCKFIHHFLAAVTKKRKMLLLLLILTVFLFITTLRLPVSLNHLQLKFHSNMDINSTTLMENHNQSVAPLSATYAHPRSLIIVILSARRNFAQRKLVRETYGAIKKANNITISALYFMLGDLDKPDDERVDPSKIEAENMAFGDIVMGHFVDSYRNLTMKTVMAYEWIRSICQDDQFVLKTDDDVLVNIFKLTQDLNELSPTDVKSSNFWCIIHWGENTVTEEISPFYVKPGTFSNDLFPDHCAGLGYVTTVTVVDRIIKEVYKSFVGELFAHEDVFMTAIVPEKINSKIDSDVDRLKLVERYEWQSYDLETLMEGDNSKFLVDLLRCPIDRMENYLEFRKRFGKAVFYLFTHDSEFEERYRKLWRIIRNTFKSY